MEHGIVPRKITYCPPAFAAPSQQAGPLSDEQRAALKGHAEQQDRKRLAFNERVSRIQRERWGT